MKATEEDSDLYPDPKDSGGNNKSGGRLAVV